MKDNATVISVGNDFARVKVSPKIACCECSARSLCAGLKNGEGQLKVRNPLHAGPGDEVEIEVPETNYHQELIMIFGLLLAGCLAGLGLGYWLMPLGRFSAAENGFFGLGLGLFLSAFGLYRYYRGRKEKPGYPVIVEILKKGGLHG